MRELYCITNGRLNEVTSRIARRINSPYQVNRVEGVLGSFPEEKLHHVVRRLSEDGYYDFGQCLTKEQVSSLETFARQVHCVPVGQSNGRSSGPLLYDSANPVAPKYDIPPTSLLKNALAQELVADTSLMGIAQAYLGAKPCVDSVAMWWSTSHGNSPSSEAAQLYHFDMDRLRFIKFFFYLTDVTSETGPHCYVRGSHRQKPSDLFKIRRFRDEEIAPRYSADAAVELTGVAGTALAVDTSGFHKGKHLVRGERLIMEVEFAMSLFGANYGRAPVGTEDLTPEFARQAAAYPFTYRNLVD
jgi:hypothetical protein